MRGSVVKRTDAKGRARYYAVIEVAPKPGQERRKKWLTDPSTGSAFTSRKAAEAHVARSIVEEITGGLVDASDSTFDQWAAKWLASKRSALKVSTWSSYERNIRNHLSPDLGGLRLQKVTAEHVQALFDRLATEGLVRKHQPPQPLSQKTLRYLATILTAIFDAAVEQRVIHRNPAAHLTVPKVAEDEHRDLQWWSAPELARFLDHIADHSYGPVLTTLALSAARRGEILALTWRDVDLDKRRLMIRRTTGRVGGMGMVTSTTKTRAGQRSIVMDDDLLTVIERQRDRQQEDRGLLGVGYQDHDLVFAEADGTPINPDAISRAFARESKAAGLRPIRLHDLRHTWATLALLADVHPKVVQERLGHSHVSVTLGIYSHVAPVMHEEAAATVASLIRASRDPKVTPLRAAR